MNYKRCKVYHDGSHYIGIPEGKFLSRSRPRKASPVEDEYADGLDASKKAYFEECYVQYQDCPKREQRERIAVDMLPFFESVEESSAYVDAQFDRKKRNLICRRMRAFRRVNLQPLLYSRRKGYGGSLPGSHCQNAKDRLTHTGGESRGNAKRFSGGPRLRLWSLDLPTLPCGSGWCVRLAGRAQRGHLYKAKRTHYNHSSILAQFSGEEKQK